MSETMELEAEIVIVKISLFAALSNTEQSNRGGGDKGSTPSPQ